MQRQEWRSKIGFILAASGSAIGLGNIVFFSANAYKFGAGAFYLPYLIALIAVGIPVMLLEFGVGNYWSRAFPQAMGKIGGKVGEMVGWWALLNALFITMYYVTILGWVLGMLIKSISGELWLPAVSLPAFAFPDGKLANPYGSFFALISSWFNVLFVSLVWAFNILLVVKGTRSIEAGVKIMMPLMWLFMLVLLFRGITLPDGINGFFMLMTPDFSVLSNPQVWQGAFSQIFFTLSLGFGVMAAYASYLPKKTDHTTNTIIVAGMNCSFEMIAGLAVFALLFVFSLTPKASTLSMMFFIVPQGLSKLSGTAQIFGVLFFTLLLMAGLSSSISLIEAMTSALIDKFRWRRLPTVITVSIIGILGSIACALPVVIDKTLKNNGTLGLTILDLIDHYAYTYGLLLVGLFEAIIVGWFFPVSKLREFLNQNSKIKLGRWFDVSIKYIIPLIILSLLAGGIISEFERGSLYGSDFELGGFRALPLAMALLWAVGTFGGALVLTLIKKGEKNEK